MPDKMIELIELVRIKKSGYEASETKVKYELLNTLINERYIIKIEPAPEISLNEVIKQIPDLRPDHKISKIIYQVGQYTNTMYIIGDISILQDKFRGQKQLLNG